MRTFCLLALPLLLSLGVSGDVRSSLESTGIIALFPSDPEYAAAITPCKSSLRTPGTYIANGLGGRNGSIVVDLSNFVNITVQPKGTAIIESGNRLGGIAATLGEAGRALPHGSCAYVGIGGHASFGGFGFTSRMWGLTLDTISAVNVVLANGTSTNVNSQNYPDLFWALRGAASSFGIVTSIEVETFPAPPTGTIFQYSWDGLTPTNATRILSVIQQFIATGDVPSYLGGEINLFRGSVVGTISISFEGGWYAPLETLNATVQPLLDQILPVSRTSFFTGTYLETAENLAGGSLDTTSAPDGHDTFYAKSLMTPQSSPMSDSTLLAYTTYLAYQGFDAEVVSTCRQQWRQLLMALAMQSWFIQMELYGGKTSAINAVSPDATAFAHRQSLFSIQFYSSAPNSIPFYPESGFSFLDGNISFKFFTFISLTAENVGLVDSITSNCPYDWNYG
ncbi:hypothetical protein H0H92_004124 [Tricholoma furcatifolium]|nr:hypothetical protein H0H92_004124 [Tricholoma furcatifolium]